MTAFMDEFGEWMVDGVQVEAAEGLSVEGQGYAVAAALGPVLVEDKERMVRSATGQEVLSTVTLYVPAEAPVKPAVGDRVVLASGKRTLVLTTHDLAAYGVLDHLVVSCE